MCPNKTACLKNLAGKYQLKSVPLKCDFMYRCFKSQPCFFARTCLRLVCCERTSTGPGYSWYGRANQQKTFWEVLEGWKWIERLNHRLGDVAVLCKWQFLSKYFYNRGKKCVKSKSHLATRWIWSLRCLRFPFWIT